MPLSADSASAYDYVIIGGGAAGLSLAYYLAQEPRWPALIELKAEDQRACMCSF